MTDMTSVEGVINHLWLTVKSEPNINRCIGLKYISHRWGDTPFWYLWFDGISGVYKLQLKSVQSRVGYDWLAEFAVKYYPLENEQYFEGLSLLEQMCRKSIAFKTETSRSCSACPCHSLHSNHEEYELTYQSTGTPSLEFQDEIPDDFFFAGKILLARADTSYIVGCEAQDSWRVIMATNYYLDDDRGNSYKVLRQGEVDRDYPGLEISSLLYRKIHSSLFMLNKYSEVTENEKIKDGFAFFSDGQNLWRERSKEINHWLIYSHMKSEPGVYLAPIGIGDWVLDVSD